MWQVKKMNIKTLIKCFPLQVNQKKYEQFVKKTDCKKLLEEEPPIISDKFFDNQDLVITSLNNATEYFDIHKKLNEKYNLFEIANADTDFEKAIQILRWLTDNTFYNGAHLHQLTDNTIDILNYAFGKSFKNAINCRW